MDKFFLLKWMDAFCRQKGAEHDFDERKGEIATYDYCSYNR